jgi:hypothetical protein
MKHWIVFGVAMLACANPPASAAIRAVFVGVDRYAYSQTNVETAEFKDLRGAVADTQHIKAAFRSAYGLDLDVPDAGQCQSANSVSITLTDACATRAAILKALDEQIKASSRGDTLVFYFAGHGSQVYDDQVFDQASEHNDTIMPTDARKPGASEPTDILDRELRDIIDRATSADVNVVTIFDSCNSGTATRGDIADGEGRSAPPLRVKSVRPAARSRGLGRGGGYRVHFAAAADGEVAREVGGAGVRSGVFTSALAQTLAAMPDASFADMAAEVRLKVNEGGHSLQTPQAEGELQATLGGKSRPVPLYEARPANGAVLLEGGGQLTGVTRGSTYALFASTTEARKDGAKPLATARVTEVAAASATLALDGPTTAALPSRLVARETAHVFGETTLLVRNEARVPAERDLVGKAIAASSVARIGEPAQLVVAKRADAFHLFTRDGTEVASLGSVRTPDFEPKLLEALQKVAHVQTLLALRTDPSTAKVRFCIANGDYDIYKCPSPATPVLAVNQALKISVINDSSAARYIYVFGIDEQYNVAVMLPPNGGRDPAVAPGRPLQDSSGTVTDPGLYRFVTVATDAPINAAALEQRGTRDPAGCRTALEQLLCNAAAGTRDPSVPRVGQWTAIVVSAIAK